MDIGARGSRQTETVQCVFRSESLTDSNTHASSSPPYSYHHELPGYRIRFKPTTLLLVPRCTTVAGGSSVHQLTVVPLAPSLQDKRKRARNPQTRRPTGYPTGLISIAEESVRITPFVTCNLLMIPLPQP